MNKYVEALRKTKELIDLKPVDSDFNYACERLEYFQEQLFKYAKFKVGDRIQIGKDMNLTQESSPGYWPYRDRLQVGCGGTILEIDHYNGHFRYSVIMDPQKKNDGYFALREETLKPEGWDNGENM